MRHEKTPRFKSRDVNAQRLRAAEKRLASEQDRLGLFAIQVASEQPTAEQRIDEFDRRAIAHDRARRIALARLWKMARRLLNSMIDTDRLLTITTWNQSRMPGTPEMFHEHVARYPARVQAAIANGEQWFAFLIEGEPRIVLWKPEHVPKHAFAGPFEKFQDAVDALPKRA